MKRQKLVISPEPLELAAGVRLRFDVVDHAGPVLAITQQRQGVAPHAWESDAQIRIPLPLLPALLQRLIRAKVSVDFAGLLDAASTDPAPAIEDLIHHHERALRRAVFAPAPADHDSGAGGRVTGRASAGPAQGRPVDSAAASPESHVHTKE